MILLFEGLQNHTEASEQAKKKEQGIEEEYTVVHCLVMCWAEVSVRGCVCVCSCCEVMSGSPQAYHADRNHQGQQQEAGICDLWLAAWLIRRLPSFTALSGTLKKGHNLPCSLKPQMQLISQCVQTICLSKNYRSHTHRKDLGLRFHSTTEAPLPKRTNLNGQYTELVSVYNETQKRLMQDKIKTKQCEKINTYKILKYM